MRSASKPHTLVMKLLPTSTYVRELRPLLPAETFAPATSRLLWLPVHLTAIAATIVALSRGWLPALLWPVAVLVLGVSFAGLTFLSPETLHGGVVRGRSLRNIVGWIGFLPFVLSPRLWRVWHNREHHAHTNHATLDPDKYPILQVYQGSRIVRVVTDGFSLGGRRLTGVLSLLFGFTGQSTKILLSAHKRGWMNKQEHRAAKLETIAAIAVWATLAWLVGARVFVFAYVLPLVVANWIVMAYILTNHGLNPLTETNDPLVNSLSVSVPRVWEFLTLGFGYHVEHHLFPAMSTRNAPAVRALLLQKWPERYQSMPLGSALLQLHRTARVYRDATTLTDPRSGAIWSALMPRDA
jgi:fatty acid desaturase